MSMKAGTEKHMWIIDGEATRKALLDLLGSTRRGKEGTIDLEDCPRLSVVVQGFVHREPGHGR